MKLKLAISVAAATLISGAALADQQNQRNQTTSGSVAVGTSAAGPQGAVANGGAGSAAMQSSKHGQKMRKHNRNRGGDQMSERTSTQRCIPSSAATTANNTAYADANRAAGSSSTSGTAQGAGSVASASGGEAYATRDTEFGTDAGASGASVATAREPTRRC